MVDEPVHAQFHGWDFGWLTGRVSGGDPTGWSYDHERARHLRRGRCVLDIDTGGGELLASLGPLPTLTIAVEAWERRIRSFSC